MKPFKVVCIEDCDWWDPIGKKDYKGPAKNDIVTVISVETINGESFYTLSEYRKDLTFQTIYFRPVSDCGPAICEWIEETHFKELEYQEAIKQ